MRGGGRFGSDYKRRLAADMAKKKTEEFSSPPPSGGIPSPTNIIYSKGFEYLADTIKDIQLSGFPNIPEQLMQGKEGEAALTLGLGIAGAGGKGKAAAKTVKLARGRFEGPRKGLAALAEIITGDPTQTSFVMKRYPTQAGLVREGAASLRGVDDPAESQVKYFRSTAKSGFERAGNWLDISFPQLGRLADASEASINDLSLLTRGKKFSFGDPTPSSESVKRALDIRRADLGPKSSSFGFVTAPMARGGNLNVTAGKEHIGGSAYQGANIASQVLKAAEEGASIDDIIPILTKLEKGGTAALNPNEIILVDAFFNSQIKGSLPYEIARKTALEQGDLPFIKQFGEGAATNEAYIDYINRMSRLDETLVDPVRMERFAKDIKPKVRFGTSTFGVGKGAFDPSNSLAETRKQLAEFLMGL